MLSRFPCKFSSSRTQVKGSDWLGDQDAIHYMCREAPNTVIEVCSSLLEHVSLKRLHLAHSWNILGFLSLEPRKGRYTRELSVVNLSNTVKVARHIDVQQQQTGRDTPSFIPYTANRFATTPIFLLNILHSI
jgi:hypothetical protein